MATEIEFPIKKYCFYCKKVTKFITCINCGRRYCINHAKTESCWETDYKPVPYCYRCFKGEDKEGD